MILFDGLHLATDSGDLDELHDFARRIGLRRRWFQDHRTVPHYDLFGGMPAAATRGGAERVDGKELVRRCKRRKDHDE